MIYGKVKTIKDEGASELFPVPYSLVPYYK